MLLWPHRSLIISVYTHPSVLKMEPENESFPDKTSFPQVADPEMVWHNRIINNTNIIINIIIIIIIIIIIVIVIVIVIVINVINVTIIRVYIYMCVYISSYSTYANIINPTHSVYSYIISFSPPSVFLLFWFYSTTSSSRDQGFWLHLPHGTHGSFPCQVGEIWTGIALRHAGQPRGWGSPCVQLKHWGCITTCCRMSQTGST